MEIWYVFIVCGEYYVFGMWYFVDGYIFFCLENFSGVVYEFYGCWYYGCFICYKNGKEFINLNIN